MPDWLDQVNTTPPKTPAAGASGDWLEQVDTTPPDWRSTPAAKNIATGAQVGALSGIRVLSAIPDLLANVVQGFGSPSAANIGMTEASSSDPSLVKEAPATQPHSVWTPSEEIIKDIGKLHGAPLELGDDAPQWAKTAEAVTPWLIPTGNQITRLKEAPGVFNKLMTAGRSELGNAADWFISDDMQKWARDNGYSPAVQTLLGIVGASARHATSAAGGKAMPIVAGRPGDESGQNYDVNRAISPNAPPLKSVVDPDSSFGKLSSGFSAFPFSSTGEKGALDAQEKAITDTANSALQQFAPGSTPVQEAGPESLNDFATDLANQSRSKILANEQELKTRSDNIEAAIDPNRRVSAQPVLDAALSVATDPNAGDQVRRAAEAAYHRIASNVDPVTGSIAFNALKTERSTFGAIVDNMFQPSSGARSAKDTVARSISPIEDAMSAQMQQAANDAGQGPAWKKLDADWSAHSQVKRNLADTAGVLDDANAPQPWEKYATSDDITSNLNSAVKGGDMPTLTKLSSLTPETPNQAIAETIAAKGQPAHPKSMEHFRPDVFAQQASSGVNQNVLDHIEQQAPGAGAKLQAAVDAAKTTAEPMERGGLRRTLASVAAGGAAALGGYGALGAGGVAALPFTALLTSALHDPSFIRAVAGRQFTPDNIAGLLTQYAQHAGLGARPDYVDPVAALQSGVGQAANAVSSLKGPVSDLANTLLKYTPGLRR
jgi:hypothetical protein